MQLVNQSSITREAYEIHSAFLERIVRIDCLGPHSEHGFEGVDLLLINDGQNMEELGLEELLNTMISERKIRPLLCVAIHAGDRIMEYGTANIPDYLGRGYKAAAYTRFVLEELIPFIKSTYSIIHFNRKAFAGFSLGGLSAIDIVWNHPNEFNIAGVFSGSFWWRTKGLDDGYVEATDRIMHAQIRNGNYHTGLKFFLQTGALDETMDRNNNGIIDSIDDTLGLIEELVLKGYQLPGDILYLEMQEGRHDIPTWSRAMPEFLQWAFQV